MLALLGLRLFFFCGGGRVGCFQGFLIVRFWCLEMWCMWSVSAPVIAEASAGFRLRAWGGLRCRVGFMEFASKPQCLPCGV